MALRVLIIDDHTLFRQGLQELLTRRNLDVVGALGDGNVGMARIRELRPDIVLLDLRMRIVDGLSVLRQLKRERMNVPIAVLTLSNDEHDLVSALRGGARGYLLKNITPNALVAAIESIVAGETVVAPELIPSLTDAARGKFFDSGNLGQLTSRETDILTLLADGQSNKLIARNLGITEGTVKLHVQSVLRKLGLHSRVEAAVLGVENGLRVRQPSMLNGNNDGSFEGAWSGRLSGS